VTTTTSTALVTTMRCPKCRELKMWCSCSTPPEPRRKLRPPKVTVKPADAGCQAVEAILCPHRRVEAVVRPGMARDEAIRRAFEAAGTEKCQQCQEEEGCR